jgi:solute carrier family 35 protein
VDKGLCQLSCSVHLIAFSSWKCVQVMGFFVFGGVKVTVFILLGITFNTVGGVWYTAIKFKEKHMKERTVITEQHNGSKAG